MGARQPPRRVQGRPLTDSVVRLLPDVSGIDKTFDYVVPERFRDHVRVGSQLRVDLHGRRVAGWVVDVDVVPETDPARLKPILRWSGHGPNAAVVDVARWVAHRWAGRLGSVLTSAMPERGVSFLPEARYTSPTPRRPHPQAVELLRDGGGVLRLAPAADPLSAIAAACGLGPCLVIVPSARQAALLGSRIRSAGLTVAVWPRDWAGAAGGVDVTIGARGAALASLARIASIVVVDEHDEALYEQRNPTWNARDVALERGRRAGVPVLLTSPCPTLVATHRARATASAARSDERAGWPIVEVVDQSTVEPWKVSLLGAPLAAALRDHEKRVVCVLNTVGRSGRLACRACSAMIVCERCAALLIQRADRTLACANCGVQRPAVCQTCGGLRLSSLRTGVTRLRDEFEAAAGRPVVEVTSQSTNRAARLTTGQAVERPDGSGEDHANVFVGTEAVLHRVEYADVVAFLDFDQELLAPRYRAAEQALALVARAGRIVGGRGGRVMLQTRLADHPVVKAALLSDPTVMVGEAVSTRESLGFPPFGALAVVSGPGASDFARSLGETDGVVVFGDDKVGFLVRAGSELLLADALARTPRPAERVRIAVDPPRV